MTKHTAFATLILLGTSLTGPVQAQEKLNYVAIEPCRIADTRKSSQGVINANTSRNFKVYGDAGDLAAQGGQVDCQNPESDSGAKPLAASVYIVAVPAESSSGNGIISAYPSNEAPPPRGEGATLNFPEDMVIGNTTIATLCNSDENSCPSEGRLGILVRDTNQHVVIDVQGYFYKSSPLPGYEIVKSDFAAAGVNSVSREVLCPDDKKVLGGGGLLSPFDQFWVLDSSLPRPDGRGWQVRYKTTGDNYNAAGSVWAICATID